MKLNREKIKELLPNKQVKRNIEEKFIDSVLNTREISVLYGPRQTGKSTLAITAGYKALKKNWEVYYYNLDKQIFTYRDPQEFIDDVISQKHQKKALIIIDEAQRITEPGLFFKYIHDISKDIKIILTGSASLEIRSKIKEPLTGRKIEFHLNTLTLQEFLQLRDINLDIKNISGVVRDLIIEYMVWGGYPRVVLESNLERKREILKEITQSYLIKDIGNLFNIQDEYDILLIVTYIAENVGNLFSIDNATKFTGIKREKTKDILFALKKSFVISELKPYFKTPSKEIKHSPKLYFFDNGIRNAILGRFNYEDILYEIGSVFENLVYNVLQNRFNHGKIHYWRNINQTEIDFICSPDSNRLFVYESKYTYKAEKQSKALGSFKKQYGSKIEDIRIITMDNIIQLLD